jgi:hypothetical protein
LAFVLTVCMTLIGLWLLAVIALPANGHVDRA